MKFIRFFFAVAWSAMFIPAGFLGAADGPPVKVIITTDLHGYLAYDPERGRPGLARLKAYADTLSAEGYLTYLMDCGDAVSGGAYAQADRGRLTAELMGLAGYRVLTPGNHEFDHNEAENNFLYYSDVLLPLMRRADGRLEVSAVNLSRNNENLPGVTRSPVVVHDETIENPEGLRLIAVGVTHPYTARPTLAPSIPGYDFGLKNDRAGTLDFILSRLNSGLAEYRRDNDVVIVLSHLGEEDVRNPARVAGPELAAADRVDFIADGHSHRAVAPLAVGKAFYGNGGCYLENFLEITVTRDQRRMQLKNFSDLAELAPDPVIEDRLARFEREQGFGEVILNLPDKAFNSHDFKRGSVPLGRLITRSMARAAGAEVALHNSGAIRAGLPEGPVTVGRMYDVLPFANNLLSYRLTGREIEALFQGYLKDGPGRVQFHGVKVIAYPRPDGILSLAGIQAGDGGRLEPDRVYTVAVNGFLNKGRGGFSFQGRESRDLGDLAGAVIKELRQLDPSGPDLEELAETNLVIHGSRAEAEEHWKLLTEKGGSDEPSPTR